MDISFTLIPEGSREENEYEGIFPAFNFETANEFNYYGQIIPGNCFENPINSFIDDNDMDDDIFKVPIIQDKKSISQQNISNEKVNLEEMEFLKSIDNKISNFQN